MNKLFVDVSDKPDNFLVKLLPTSYSVCYRLRSRIFTKYIDININYYNGLTKIYKSIKADLKCDVEFEKQKLKESITDFIKITDVFEIYKKDLTDNIIKSFRWYEPLIEYQEHELPIDPYILGRWLGDGSSNCIDLTSIDIIIIEYWKLYAEKNNLNVKIHNVKDRKTKNNENETEKVCSYLVSSSNRVHINPILIEFKKLNLINNKHIPEIFLKNSVENRLKLLAGIIDTDGYLEQNSRYEIIQKNKVLSENIITLAKSLGFFCNSYIKKAYASNTVLKTVRDYNRIFIYINQINLEIPVLLERKKCNCSNKKYFHNPKILINNNSLNERIIWNQFLDDLLIKNVKDYRSQKGKKLIPWKCIQKEIKEFNTISSDALRKRYQNINDTNSL